MNFDDVVIIDAVSGHCARLGIKASALSALPFLEVIRLLSETCQRYPEWVYASKSLRARLGPVCHQECHLERINLLMVEVLAKKPAEPEPKVGNVVDLFPANTTKH